MATLHLRVKAGMAYMDVLYGRKWRANISLKNLDLSCENFCILGQTGTSYSDHREKLGLTNKVATNLGFAELNEHGGLLKVRNNSKAKAVYNRLTAAWRRALSKTADPSGSDL